MTVEDVVRDFPALAESRPADFEEMAEAVFRFQVEHNEVYRRFVGDRRQWMGWRKAPALPIEAFKLAPVTSFPPEEAARVFESSGTSRMTRSKHFVRDLSVYDRSALTHFESVFGGKPRIIIGHLPGYADAGRRSSLVHMVARLIETFGAPGSGTFVENRQVLFDAIEAASSRGIGLMVFGAAFGLLDLVEDARIELPDHAIVVETGGMKTHRRAIARSELHERLSRGFGVSRSRIYSEYGMAELLSQAYAGTDGVFRMPPWMRFEIVDPENPDEELREGEAGALSVFDLANVYTVSAIATRDLAVRRGDGFEVIGRVSGAELRGCNFLLERDA